MPKAVVTTTSAAAVLGNPYRKGLIIENRSGADMYLGFRGPVTALGDDDAGFTLKAGERLVLAGDRDRVFGGELHALGTGGNQDLIFVEVL